MYCVLYDRPSIGRLPEVGHSAMNLSTKLTACRPKVHTVVPLLRDHPWDRQKVVSQKRWSLTRGNLVWGICAFVPSKAGLSQGGGGG